MLEVKVSIGYTVPLGANTTSHIRAGVEAAIETTLPLEPQFKEVKKASDKMLVKLSDLVDEFITKKQDEYDKLSSGVVEALPPVSGPVFELDQSVVKAPVAFVESPVVPSPKTLVEDTPVVPIFKPEDWGFGPGSGFVK